MNEWLLLALAAGASIALRLAPEAWLRGRAPPPLLARSLAWVPVTVAGALVAVLHVGAAADVRATYLVAAIPAALTLLVRRSFYLPLLTGAVTVAVLRAFGWP